MFLKLHRWRFLQINYKNEYKFTFKNYIKNFQSKYQETWFSQPNLTFQFLNKNYLNLQSPSSMVAHITEKEGLPFKDLHQTFSSSSLSFPLSFPSFFGSALLFFLVWFSNKNIGPVNMAFTSKAAKLLALTVKAAKK